MKSPTLLPTLALAALVGAATPALAQTVGLDTSQPASGAFVFSTTLLDGYSLASATVGAVDGATDIIDTDGSYSGTPGTVIGASAGVTGVTFNPDNTIASITSSGGNFQSFPAGGVPAVSTGGYLTVTNLTYNGATNQIDATLNGTDTNGNPMPTLTTAVFNIGTLAYSTDGGATFNTIASPSTFAWAPGSYQIQASGLTLASTTGANNVKDYFIQSLGLGSLGTTVLNVINDPTKTPAGFGTLTTSVTIKAVPEPSTYAMLGVGLAGVAASAWRRRKS